MFKRKKKKTDVQTPEYSRFSIAPEPKSESKPNPDYVPPASVVPPEPIKFVAGLRVYLTKRVTTEDCKEWNPTLHLNELAVEYNDNEIVGYKIGDGETRWSELPYITKLTDISEFWIYVNPFCRNKPYIAAKIILDPFMINNFLGGTEQC